MTKSQFDIFIFTATVAISRFVFRSHKLYDLDSVNFALAISHFDPHAHQPHPPGYFLYIQTARLLNFIVHDANLSLVILSIAASCGTIAVIYKLAFEWFGRDDARLASLIFLCSPLGWFHGTVALTYAVEAFFSAFLGYLCWGLKKKGNGVLISGIVLGVAAGVRPSSLLLIGPLYLYSLRRCSATKRFMGVGVLVLALFSWFLPMIYASGGFTTYFGALLSLWHIVPSRNTVFNSSPATSIARACTLVFVGLLNFGTASFVLGNLLKRDRALTDREKKYFTIVWVAPALCFFTFIFFKFINSGYLLLLTAPGSIWLGHWGAELYRLSPWRRSSKITAIAVGIALNTFLFLESPFYCSYKSIRQVESQLSELETELPALGAANDTVVIGFDSHFLGYRHAGYYLPDYLTLQYPAVAFKEGTRVFAMHDRNTELISQLPIGTYQRFVLFPLPTGETAYAAYLAKVTNLLHREDLQTVRIGQRDFVTGPVSLLPRLFPENPEVPGPGVSNPLHSGMADVNSREHSTPGVALRSAH